MPTLSLRETQQALTSADLRFRALAESATDAIVSADQHGNITFWNKAAEAIFGYAEIEVIGRSLTLLMPTHFRPLHDAGMERLNQTGQPHVIGKTVELQGLRKNGEVFPIELSLSAWMGGDKTYYSGIIRDISARKEAEAILHQYAKELEERNHELDAYTRTIAHDLKAPLNQMVTYASLIRYKYEPDLPEAVLNYLNRIEKAGKGMGEMINQLLWLATVRDAATQLEAVNMAKVATHAVSRFQTDIEQHQISVEIAPTLPTVLGHSAWLEEVLANLVGNAIKYRGQQNREPKIEIIAHPEDDHIRFEVRDNGLGIPDDSLATLFEMFSRAHTHEAEGFGLGLSIVHRIITRLGGQVGVENNPHRGSTFWFRLPNSA